MLNGKCDEAEQLAGPHDKPLLRLPSYSTKVRITPLQPATRNPQPRNPATPTPQPRNPQPVFHALSLSSTLLLGFCLLVSFLYAGIEAGLLSLNRARLRSRVHQGERGAVRLGRLLARPGRLLATVLLVTNFADVAALVLITDACVRWFGRIGYFVAGAAMLPVYLLGLQLLPKSLFRRFPYRATAALSGLLEGTTRLLGPALAAGRFLLGRTLLPPSPVVDKGLRGVFGARQDFKRLAAEGERSGALTPAEHRMIDNVIDFNALLVRELTLPLPTAFILRADTNPPTVADLLKFARAGDLSYLPVCETDGTPVALLDVFVLRLERDPGRSAAAYLRRAPMVVAPNDPALRVLRRLRSLRLGVALVRNPDEGNLTGLVRTRDLLHRLVRQRPDEAERPR